MVVFGLGKDHSFKSVLGHCAVLWKNFQNADVPENAIEKCLHFKTWMLLEEKPQKHAASWMYCHPGLINSAASNCKHDSGGKQPIDMMMILTP